MPYIGPQISQPPIPITLGPHDDLTVDLPFRKENYSLTVGQYDAQFIEQTSHNSQFFRNRVHGSPTEVLIKTGLVRFAIPNGSNHSEKKTAVMQQATTDPAPSISPTILTPEFIAKAFEYPGKISRKERIGRNLQLRAPNFDGK
jgi:hypothetical protein